MERWGFKFKKQKSEIQKKTGKIRKQKVENQANNSQFFLTYNLTRDNLLAWDAREVGYTFSVCLNGSCQSQQCLYGVLFRSEFLFSCFSGPVGVGLNELKRKLLISDTQHYGVTVPRKFCAVCCYFCRPSTYTACVLQSPAVSTHMQTSPQPWGVGSDSVHILQRRKLRHKSSGVCPR